MARNRRGTVVIAMIAAMIIIDLIIVTVVISGARDHDLTVRRVETVQAYYAAESGLNMAMREALFDLDEDGDCRVGSVSYDGVVGNDPTIGSGRFMVTASTSGSDVTLKSYGRSGSARRQIAMTFQLAGPSMITFDNASSTTGEVGNVTFNHTIGSGSDRLLVVCFSSEGGVDTTSATYNGVPMTPTAAIHTVGSGTLNHVEIWYMLEADLPAAGTYQVFVETGGPDGDQAAAISVFGAAQQPPEATAVNDDGDSGASSISTGITTLTDNAWIFEAVVSGNAIGDFAPTAGQDERYDEVASSSRGAGSTMEVTTAGPVTQSWSASGSNRLAHALAAFAPK